MVDFTRTYHLVIPSAATLTLAVYLLVASDRLRRRGLAVAWGLALGATLVSRSMMLAFAPSLVLGAIWMLVVERAFRRRRALNLALGLAAAACTSLLWYATSWRPILDYLSSAGYGAASANYGSGVSPATTHFWARELEGAINGSLYLPLASLLAVVFAVAAGQLLLRHRGAGGLLPAIRQAARSDFVVPALVVAEGYLALSSSRNEGTGFVVPILPSLVALGVAAAFAVRPPGLRAALVGGLVAVSVFQLVVKADLVDPLSRARGVTVPLLGPVEVVNGQGYLQRNLAANAGYELGPPTRWLAGRERRWLPMYARLAAAIRGAEERDPRVRLAPQEPLLNASLLRLEYYGLYRSGGDLGYVSAGGDTPAAYEAYLREEQPQVVVTVDRAGRQYGPPVTPALVEAALRHEG